MNKKLLLLTLFIAQASTAQEDRKATPSSGLLNAAEFMEHGVSTNALALPMSDKITTTFISSVVSVMAYAIAGSIANKFNSSVDATLLSSESFKDSLGSYLRFSSAEQGLVDVTLPLTFIASWNFLAKRLYPENAKAYINNELLNIVLKHKANKDTLKKIDALYPEQTHKRAAAFTDLKNILDTFAHAQKMLGTSQSDTYAQELITKNNVEVQVVIDLIKSEKTWATEYAQAMAEKAMSEINLDNSEAAYETIQTMSATI